MAIKLHRSGGFIFDNFKINNTNNIYLLDVVKNATPTKIRYDYIVPGRNGSSSWFNRLDDNYIDVVVGIYDVNINERRSKQNLIIKNIVNKKARLLFLDNTGQHYMAECIDAIEEEETEVFTQLTIHFKCSWCKYGMQRDITLVDGVNKVYNLGNYEADNIIEITANNNCEKIIIDNGINSFTINNILQDEKIIIDSENMIVYQIINGTKQSVLTRFEGKFIKIPLNISNLTLSGQNYNATVKVRYNYIY